MSEEQSRSEEEQTAREFNDFEAALRTVDKLIEMDFRTYDEIRLKIQELNNLSEVQP